MKITDLKGFFQNLLQGEKPRSTIVQGAPKPMSDCPGRVGKKKETVEN